MTREQMIDVAVWKAFFEGEKPVLSIKSCREFHKKLHRYGYQTNYLPEHRLEEVRVEFRKIASAQ